MSSRSKTLMEIEAIIVAYAMSRLDALFLKQFAFSSWKQAFAAAGKHFGIPPSSLKNLRDEFDPIHENARKGWHQRPMRPNRQRVLGEFCDCSDDALIEVVIRLLQGDKQIEDLIVEPLAKQTSSANVAGRLRTGRLAEEHFLSKAHSICGIAGSDLIDVRAEACGYDFGIKTQPEIAIEIKGMKKGKGSILISDHEWSVAKLRKGNYWLVVIGQLESTPRASLIKDPTENITVRSVMEQRTIFSWTATVEVL